jgi:hypothetical protein
MDSYQGERIKRKRDRGIDRDREDRDRMENRK